MHLQHLVLGTALAFSMSGCGAAAAQEPSEAQMKEAALYAINHPPRHDEQRADHDQILQEGGLREPHSEGIQLQLRLASGLCQYWCVDVQQYIERVLL